MGQTSTETVRYRALDGYRFVAAAGVAVSHYDLAFDLKLGSLSPAIPQLGELVDFFFVLSGFVIGVTYAGRLATGDDYLTFLRARLARIWPLHAATTLAALLLVPIAALFHVAQNHPEMNALSGLPANLALMHAWGLEQHLTFNGPSWSISAEWLCYLLCPLLLIVAQRLPARASLALAALYVAAMIVVRNATGLGDWTAASFDFGALRAIPLFFGGLVISVALSCRTIHWTPSWLVPHALFVASLLSLHFVMPRELTVILFALVVVTAALAERGVQPSLMGGRIMGRLGDASYAVYLTHFLVAIPVVFVLRQFGLLGTPVALLTAALTLAATTLISLLVYRVFERPLRRLLGPRSVGPGRVVPKNA